MNFKLVIASNNKHKINEIKHILGDKFESIMSLSEVGVIHETIEDGMTFMDNALKKAREISRITGCAALADDSGLCVDALDGAPGVFSARYSGEENPELRDSKNNELILKKLIGVDRRTAHFTCAVALVYPDGRELTAEGYMNGEIATSQSGNGGFGYDPLFFIKEKNCTVAELTEKEKNQISHRAMALKNLLIKL